MLTDNSPTCKGSHKHTVMHMCCGFNSFVQSRARVSFASNLTINAIRCVVMYSDGLIVLDIWSEVFSIVIRSSQKHGELALLVLTALPSFSGCTWNDTGRLAQYYYYCAGLITSRFGTVGKGFWGRWTAFLVAGGVVTTQGK